MDEAAPARRRRWTPPARDALSRAIQASADYRPQLERVITGARQLETEAGDNPALIVALAPRIQRDLAEVEQALADIRTWMIDPRADPTGLDERRLGWPPDVVPVTQRLAALAGEAGAQADVMQDWLDEIAREAHDNPALVGRLAVLLQRDAARIATTLATLRSELLGLLRL